MDILNQEQQLQPATQPAEQQPSSTLNEEAGNAVKVSSKDLPISPASNINEQIKEEIKSKSEAFQTKINEAILLKSKGNEYFKKVDYYTSKDYYQQALSQLDPSKFYGASEAQCLKMAEISATLLNNIGSCFFNLEKWKQAQLIYNEAITVNPRYIKAIYKRALARYEMGNYEEALADIKNAFNLDKSNKQIFDSYDKIRIKYNQQAKKVLEKSKQLSQKMFSSRKTSQKKEQGEEQDKNSWWSLAALAPLAIFGLYKGVKFLKG